MIERCIEQSLWSVRHSLLVLSNGYRMIGLDCLGDLATPII
jgi:hypothetical protein